ncbi:MAG: murein hydrolase activator EnvC family protein [Wenzhouxiangella sp.]
MWRSDCASWTEPRNHPAATRSAGAKTRAGTADHTSGHRRSFAITWLLLGLLGTLIAPMPLAWASESDELEARLDQLRAEIAQIQTRLDADLASRDALRLELAQAERQVAEADRTRRATADEISHTQSQIAESEERIVAISLQATEVSTVLGAQLRLAHQQGGQSRLKLMLNQDDPRELARQMAYHGYLSRARLALLAELASLNQQLVESRAGLHLALAQLAALETRQRQELEAVQAARAERDQALARLQAQIESQAAQLSAMERDAAELESLIAELAQALRDIPMDIEVPSILSLQGQLPRPVQGPLLRRFGDARGGELRWNGWLIGATAGASVRAIAHGRVAYADWLRGYGMLLILDHGDGVMSLYGHNESLLHRVGDWVAAGDEIAVVGDSGGGEPGLYFELRRDGRPLNPLQWLARP